MTAPMVFSIRPEYVARILDGSKTLELRKSCPRIDLGETALIYESRGRKRIVASFERGVIEEAPPEEIWRLHGGSTRLGIGRAAFFAYFGLRKKAFAMRLDNVKPLDIPLPAGMRAPQRWARLLWQPAALIAARWSSRFADGMMSDVRINMVAAHIGIVPGKNMRTNGRQDSTAYSEDAVGLIERELLSRGHARVTS